MARALTYQEYKFLCLNSVTKEVKEYRCFFIAPEPDEKRAFDTMRKLLKFTGRDNVSPAKIVEHKETAIVWND